MAKLFILLLGVAVLSSAAGEFVENDLAEADLESLEYLANRYEKTLGKLLYTARGVIDLAQAFSVETYSFTDQLLFLSWAVDDFLNAMFYAGDSNTNELRCQYWQVQYILHRVLFLIPNMMKIPYADVLIIKYSLDEYCKGDLDQLEQVVHQISENLPKTLEFNIPEFEIKEVPALLSCIYFQGYSQIDNLLAQLVDRGKARPAYYLMEARSNDFSKIGTPYCQKAIRIIN